jgi:hypothetical protein
LKDSALQKVREQLPLTPEEKKEVENAATGRIQAFRKIGND